MNVGDRVRMMHSKEEGIITRFLDKGMVEVAIDNDFTIPVLKREVVVIAQEEERLFRSGPEPETRDKGSGYPRSAASPTPALLSASGIFVALTHQTEDLLAVHILNNADYDLLFTYGEERQAQYRGVQNDKIGAREGKIVSHLHLKDFDKWPDLVVQFLQHRSGSPTLFEPITKRVHFKASSFYKSKKTAPVIKQEAYLFQLDSKPIEIDPQKIKEQLSEAAAASPGNFRLQPPPHEVDLHIEQLVAPGKDPSQMNNSEMLRLQLATFEDALDRAIAANMHEIIFIHGTGSGVLRKEIHKLLSRNKDIKYYEEAQKEKFGYGATLVKLK
jgi:hypothetical protein